MYSSEMENFIKSKDYQLQGDDLAMIINPLNHPQISEVKYDPGSKTYLVATNDNYQFYFKAIPYIQPENKTLVRKIV